MLKPFRPFLIGLGLFAAFNAALLGLTLFTSMGDTFDYFIGNNLITKLPALSQLPHKQLDVMALGTSVSDNGFAPSVFESQFNMPINSFNMGIHGARPDVLRTYLDYHVHHFGKPKLLLLEVTDNILSGDNYYMPAAYYLYLMKQNPGYISLLYNSPMLDSSDRKEILLSMMSDIYHYRGLFSPVVLENRFFKRLAKGKHSSVKTHAPSLIANAGPQTESPLKGWSPADVQPNMLNEEGLENEIRVMRHQTLDTIHEVNLKSLAYLLDYCKDEHIPTVMVEWPSHPRYMALFEASSFYPKYRTSLDHLSRHYNVPLISLGDVESLETRTLFQNGRHLSRQGAIKYTQKLAQEVAHLRMAQDVLGLTPSQSGHYLSAKP